MEDGKRIEGDLSPHGAILEIKWEVHKKNSDGKYAGGATDTGVTVFDIKADNRALAVEYVAAILEQIKRNAVDVNTIETDQERLRQTRIQGASKPREPRPQMFGMRGGIGGNSAGGPRDAGDVEVPGRLSALRRP